MDTAIRKTEEKLALVSSSKEALHAYQMREMALSDWTSGVNLAHEEGIRAGKLKIASEMKKNGVPAAQIERYTALSADDIAKL
jgi:predicted transposase/invertase (TIGR01784 family)